MSAAQNGGQWRRYRARVVRAAGMIKGDAKEWLVMRMLSTC